jgi:hypothetical protein
MAGQGVFTVTGIALVAVALWQNNHTSDGHYYWPFMDLFGLLILGCALIVLALNTIVWLHVLAQGQTRHSLVAALVLLAVLSPGATFVLALIVLLAVVLVPGT